MGIEYTLVRTLAPSVEPVTVEQVKMHAHIDHDVEDDLIAGWIKSGRELAEGFQRRSYYYQAWEMIFDYFPPLPINIPRAPLISIDSIKYYDTAGDETICDLDEFIIDSSSQPGRLSHAYNYFWPSVTLQPMSAVKIAFTSGYSEAGTTTASPEGTGAAIEAIPQSAKDAIILYCTYRNENRSGETDIPNGFYDLLRPDRIYIK